MPDKVATISNFIKKCKFESEDFITEKPSEASHFFKLEVFK